MAKQKKTANEVDSDVQSRLDYLETQVAGLAPPSWRPMPTGPFVGRRVEYILNHGPAGEVVGADIISVRDDVPTGEVGLRLVLDVEDYHQGIHPIVGAVPLGNAPGCWRPFAYERGPEPVVLDAPASPDSSAGPAISPAGPRT